MPGAIVSALTLLVGLAAMNSQNNLLFWIFGVLVATIIVSAGISRLMLGRVRLQRLHSLYGAVGEPLLVRYALTNRSRLLPAFNIHIEEEARSTQRANGSQLPSYANGQAPLPAQAWIMHIGPRETVHGEAVLWPTQRGRVHLDRVSIWTTFPFGIIKRTVHFDQPQQVLISPQLYELREDILRAIAPPAFMGNKTVLRSGPPDAGDEYFGLRGYRPMDTIRSIAWKRSAQLGQLVAIERSMPTPPKLRIVLNLTVPTDALPAAAAVKRNKSAVDPSPRELEERAISLAASFAHLAHHAGMEISLIALGTRVPYIGMRRGYWHLHKVMAALASIDLDEPRDEQDRLPGIDAERAGVVMIHPDRVNDVPRPIGRAEALHLTGRQLESLAIKPIGWDAAEFVNRGEKPGSESSLGSSGEVPA